jgi:hypothetical protein
MKNLFLCAGLAFLLACTHQSIPEKPGSEPPSHATWDTLLHRHVSAAGKVDYRGFGKDSLLLNQYLDSLSQHPPDPKNWSREEQLAYWINAYNAFTVKLIVDHYPVKGIQDLHPKPYVPLVNTVWHIKFFRIGNQDFNLDQIEHAILRKQFDEPRIHFAIVCASVSCPPLRNEAYVAEKMEDQLDSQARLFINDPTRNRLQPHQVDISQLFNWFTGDFTKKENLIAFLNRYATVKINPDAKIDYLEYNWDLNE